MAYVDRVERTSTTAGGKVRKTVRYRVRYRDGAGQEHAESFARALDAERRRAEIEMQLQEGRWLDPRRGDMPFRQWAEPWVQTRHDLRPTTRARLETTMAKQVLPTFGDVPLRRINSARIAEWVQELMAQGYSAATVRKAVFALRQCLQAAVDDRRISFNAAIRVNLPTERAKTPRFLTQRELERLVDAMPDKYKALVLVGGYAGLRWGEAAGLTRSHIDATRSRIIVEHTAVEVHGVVHLGQEPKTRRSKRSIPVARAVMRRIEEHLDTFVGPGADDLVFIGTHGGPLFRGTFGRHVWRPAVKAAGLDGFTFHGLRHSFVAILVAAGCNVREVSEWAGHNSVAFTLTRYGGLFADGADEAVDRLDALLG
ncbi:tyrosine-type recombinase/integrase [Luteococcus sp.]|uniref:tyrosine-type recombinase/integrase n=1 Tax=Luteococcus sp. TaxID=1969402 RepID=UPI003735F8F7